MERLVSHDLGTIEAICLARLNERDLSPVELRKNKTVIVQTAKLRTALHGLETRQLIKLSSTDLSRLSITNTGRKLINHITMP